MHINMYAYEYVWMMSRMLKIQGEISEKNRQVYFVDIKHSFCVNSKNIIARVEKSIGLCGRLNFRKYLLPDVFAARSGTPSQKWREKGGSTYDNALR